MESGPSARGVRILSLDGGIVTGYTSLIMLKRLLRLMEPEGRIYPHKHFDLICGTSSGGLIAILLGRLRLDLDEATSTYLNLMKLSEASLRQWWWARNTHRSLTAAIQDIVQEHGTKDMLMLGPDRGKGCKCFVTTATVPRGQVPIRLLRSYGDPTDNVWPHPWTVEDAALAAFGAPVYFRSHSVQHENTNYHYEDARFHGLNNPTITAWDECDRLDPKQPPHCIVNLGSRITAPTERSGNLSNWILLPFQTAWTASAVACNLLNAVIGTFDTDTHEKMQRLTRKLEPNPYFRFSPKLGSLNNASILDEGFIGKLADIVDSYVNEEETERQFKSCTRRLAFP